MHDFRHPELIQGGMGVGVSGWRLARAVAAAGGLGVVSGTALDVQLARRLQLGDLAGDLRRSLARFPYPELVERVIRSATSCPAASPPARASPRSRATPSSRAAISCGSMSWRASSRSTSRARVTTAAVGINLLQKIVLPTLPTLYGALLAGVGLRPHGGRHSARNPRRSRGALRAPSGSAFGARDRSRRRRRKAPRSASASIRRRSGLRRWPSRSRCPTSSPSSLRSRWRRSCSSAPPERSTASSSKRRQRAGTTRRRAARPGSTTAASRSTGRAIEVDLAKLRELGKPFWLAGSRGRRERWPKRSASARTASRSAPPSPSLASRVSIRSCVGR